MARKKPIDTIRNAALGGLKLPGTVAAKAVDQATKVAGAGANAVTSVAGAGANAVTTVAGAGAKTVTSRLPGGGSKGTAPEPEPAEPAEESTKVHGDPVAPSDAPEAPEAPAKKTAAKKTPAAKAPSKKAVAQPPTVKKSATAEPAKKAAAKQAAAKKAVKKAAAKAQPVNVVEELGLDPTPVAEPKTPKQAPVTKIDAEAEPRLVVRTPADVAPAIEAHHQEHEESPASDA